MFVKQATGFVNQVHWPPGLCSIEALLLDILLFVSSKVWLHGRNCVSVVYMSNTLILHKRR